MVLVSAVFLCTGPKTFYFNLMRKALLVVALTCVASFNSFGNDLKGAVAQTDITAPIGYRMAGYFEERPSTGIHDPLFAKAIVLQDEHQKVAFVLCDLVGLSLNISTNARAQASAKTGIPYSNILIAATHSHTGPMFEGIIRKYLHEAALAQNGKDPREEIEYDKFLIAQIVKAIEQANAKLEPINLRVGIAEQYGISFNRRYHMKNGRVAFNPGQLNPNTVRPAGPIDPDIGMLFVQNKKKQALGGLTVFAMHADTVGGTEYSADYPFYVSETLKNTFGSNYVSAFAAGTCGDINQINVNVKEPVKGFDVAERLGTNLGKTIAQRFPSTKKINSPEFLVKSETIAAPMQEVPADKQEWAKSKIPVIADPNTDFFLKVEAVKFLDLMSQASHRPMEVQVFRLDRDTAIVGLPCEIFVELGLAIKQQSPFKKTIVMSICNDRPSYVPTKKAFSEGSYEITNARVKPGVGEMLVETAVKLLKEAAL